MAIERRCDQRRRMAADTAVSCDRELQNKLRAVDFALVELTLYLDAYPDCAEALAYYHRLREERTRLAGSMNEQGAPLTHRDNHSQSSWQWVKTPWPWEPEAN